MLTLYQTSPQKWRDRANAELWRDLLQIEMRVDTKITEAGNKDAMRHLYMAHVMYNQMLANAIRCEGHKQDCDHEILHMENQGKTHDI